MDILFSQEKHIRVCDEGAPVEHSSIEACLNGPFCGRTLGVDYLHPWLVVPVQAHITADPAVVHQAEGGHQRHAAAQNPLLAAALPQQLHGPEHPACPALPLIAEGSGGIEEVQLHQVEAPLVQHPVKHPLQIVRDAGDIDVQGIEAAPVSSGPPVLAVHFQQPVRVLPVDFRLCLAHKGGQPQPSQQAALMALLYKGGEAIREFLRVRFHPVSHKGFPAVVNLE